MDKTCELWHQFSTFFHNFIIPFPFGGSANHEQNLDQNLVDKHDICDEEECQKYYTFETLDYSHHLRSLYENKYMLLEEAVLLLIKLKEESEQEQNGSWFELNQRDPKWMELRSKRLTASLFGAIIGTDQKWKNRARLLRQLIWKDLFKGSIATEHGVSNEDNGVDTYECYQRSSLHLQNNSDLSEQKNFNVLRPGFFISRLYPWLGASPDFIAFYKSEKLNKDFYWLGEVKCPFPRPGSKGCATLYPKIPPQYYDQIQGSMALMQLPYCDFVVWTRDQTAIERYYFDRYYVEKQLFPGLQQFYIFEFLHRCLLKEKGILKQGQIDPVIQLNFINETNEE